MEPHPVPRRRRRWVRVVMWTGVAFGALVVVFVAVGAWLYARADVSNVGDLSFRNPLRIPELDRGERGADGIVRFDLEVQSGHTSILPGEPTATWGVNGAHLGPTLRVSRGDDVEMALTNDVGETTSMHWHGMHLPARMDGGPHQPVEPGQTWRPSWTVDQPAATLWYHPHPHGETAEHVYRGVAGMLIVDDPEAAELDLPDDYGVDDIPVIIQDRSFDGDNQLDDAGRFLANVGVLGDEILVNGTHDPHVDVTTQRVRLRLLNGSNARSYDLGFIDGRRVQVVGTDGGLLSAPVDVDCVPLSPGERAEIVVTMTPGERAVLRSFPRGGGNGFTDRFNGRDDTFDILQLRAADELAPSAEVPDELVAVERIEPSGAVETRRFRLSGTQINGRDMDMRRVDATVTAGTTEVWEIENADGQAHPFHVHDVQFQVLDIDGAAPPAILGGWKDTVEVRGGDTVGLVVRFGSHSDPNTPLVLGADRLEIRDGSRPETDRAQIGEGCYFTRGSRGRPRMRSPIWLRLISDVPPAIDNPR